MQKSNDSHKSASISFPNEMHLQAAIYGLLERMGYDSVQITQGTLERGKDIVFQTEVFNSKVLCCCVIKNKPISGNVASPNGARTVALQAQQCFDTPYILGDGTEKFPKLVYIITPYPVGPDAMESVKGYLTSTHKDLTFIGGPELISLFRKHWPDYLNQEFETVTSYIEGIVKGKLESHNPLNHLSKRYSLQSPDEPKARIYIPQGFQRILVEYDSDSYQDVESFRNMKTTFNKYDINEFSNKYKSKLKKYKDIFTYIEYYQPDIRRFSDKIDLEYSKMMNAINAAYDEGIKKLLLTEKKTLDNNTSVNTRLSDITLDHTVELAAICGQALDYVVNLTKGASKIDKNPKTLDQQFKVISAVRDALESNRIVIEEKARYIIALPVNTLDTVSDHLHVVAPAGFGKTAFCRWMALRDAEAYSSDSRNPLPIYIPLHQLNKVTLTTFQDVFLKTLGRSALISPSEIDPSAPVRLYLDGLDEVPSSTRRSQIIRLAKEGHKDFSKLQIVVTSRDYIFNSELSSMIRIELKMFSAEDIEKFAEAWFESDSSKLRKFKEELNQNPSIHHLMGTPILATLIALLYEETGELPSGRIKLYEMSIDLLTGGWDLVKNVKREESLEQGTKNKILLELAVNCHLKCRRNFSVNDVRTAINAVFENSQIEASKLLDEFVTDGVVTGVSGSYYFAHLSFQEYLVARAYALDADTGRLEAAIIALMKGDSWWTEVIRFWLGTISNPKRTKDWLQRLLYERELGQEEWDSFIFDDLDVDEFLEKVDAWLEEYSSEFQYGRSLKRI